MFQEQRDTCTHVLNEAYQGIVASVESDGGGRPYNVVITHCPRTFTGIGYGRFVCILSIKCVGGGGGGGGPRLFSRTHVRNSSGLYQRQRHLSGVIYVYCVS